MSESVSPQKSRGHEVLYDSFVAEYYDYVPPAAKRADLEFFRSYAKVQGDPILELGCGTGRVLLELAKAGHRITGLDLSRRMLERCKEKLATLPAETQSRVSLVQGDMTCFDFGEKFRLITIPFRPFQHLLETEQQLACLDSVSKHLAPGGKLIVDFFQTDPRRMHDPEFHQENDAIPEFTLPDGRRVKMRDRVVAFHRAEQHNDVEMIYYVTHPGGRQERLVFAFTIRYFFRYEVEHLLARCGFRVAELYGGFDRAPLADSSAEMIFIAEKAS
jgi:SAM-dependent methyltransferase